MSILRRGTLGLALAALAATGLVPAAHADNLESDALIGGTGALGNVCRGATATGSVGFMLKRTGSYGNNQVWANSARVTVTPGSQPSGLALGGTSTTTPSDWSTIDPASFVDAGDASVSLTVPANATTGPRSATVTYSATGAGSGGGTTTRTTPVTFSWNVVDCTPTDTTAPVISKVLTPSAPDGSNGWYRSNVAVDWTVSDPESPVTLQGCVDAALTTDGSLTSSCSASSRGGNAGPVSVTLKRDATPPTLEPVISGHLGSEGWYDGEVAVSWKAGDATSGIDTATTCAPDSLGTDTASRTFSCTVSDLAGNIASASVTVKRDATDPLIVSHVAGTAGGDGWFTSDVDVTWDVSDATSSVASTAGCDKITLDHDSAGTSYTCTATDHAGNSTSSTVDVKRDATAPSAIFTLDGTKGDNGWYRGPVALAWELSDNLSGLGDVHGCVDQGVSGDGHHVSECTVTDAAGNTTEAAALIDIDATAPVITPSVTGPSKVAGWFNGDVSVVWSVTDPTSGVANTMRCDKATVTEDTKDTTFTCSATDVAGNSDSVSTTIKRDATAPVVESDVSGTRNGEWFTGDVLVAWKVTDATSGIAFSPGCSPVTVDEDTKEKAYTCSVTDVAGNTTTESTTVRRDTTAPVITPVVQGTKKGTDWFTGDVSVTWNVTDATSGVANKTHCDEATVTEDTDGVTYTCSATDEAGNGTSESVTVKRDATAPVVTLHTTGTHNGDWYTGDVTVGWAVSDATSGVATSPGCDPVTLATDTRGKTYTCAATDAAGNKTTESATVKRDATAPVIAADVSGPKKGTEWFTGDVKVSWTVTDPTSGVATSTGCEDASVTEDTVGTTYTCSAADIAGNTSSKSVTVERDSTAPTLALTGGPANGTTYYFGDVPSIATCVALDTVSQLAGPCTVTNDGVLVGSHTQVATATDNAGNVARDVRTYTVAAWRLDGFYKPVTMGTSVVNTVKAGSTVPLKFNVYKGAVPMTGGIGATFTATKVSCDGSDVQDPVDFVTTGATSLRYDAAGGQWIQNWATPSGGKGSCYRVTMTTGDGSKTSADFALK